MSVANVNRNVSDQYYRYKMPTLLTKVEGKGNGIKTVVVNITDVAKALQRPPIYILRYFGCVLGTQVYHDMKNDRYVVNGAQESTLLQHVLDAYIQKYVLCNKCKNPETVLDVDKNNVINACRACGYAEVVGGKMGGYMLKKQANDNVEKIKRVKRDKKNKNTSREARADVAQGIELM